jgi:RHS repeat-associated protein
MQTVDPSGNSNSYFYSRDHLGSIRELIRSDGQPQAQYSYSPFGERTIISETVASDFGFGGMYFHGRSGLNLTMFRAYSPSLGRWLSRDPLGESAGSNLYAYVGNNPIGFTDPLGLRVYSTNMQGPLQPGDVRIPVHPAAADLFYNGTEAEYQGYQYASGTTTGINSVNTVLATKWFANQVRLGGPWDYKDWAGLGSHPEWEDFGNFNFGYAGAAFGFTTETLLRAAGRAQQGDNPTHPCPGDPGTVLFGMPLSNGPVSHGTPPYGDEPRDQFWIKKGIEYYHQINGGSQ